MSNAKLENAIMDRYDARETAETIATALGIRERTARSVIEYMRPSRSDRATARGPVTHASNQLLAAIVRHHPEKIYD